MSYTERITENGHSTITPAPADEVLISEEDAYRLRMLTKEELEAFLEQLLEDPRRAVTEAALVICDQREAEAEAKAQAAP